MLPRIRINLQSVTNEDKDFKIRTHNVMEGEKKIKTDLRSEGRPWI